MSDEGLDSSVLRRLGSLRSGAFEGLIAIFVRTAPAMLEDITAALVADDAARLVSATHRLQGMSANMGARRLSERCEQLKTAAREQGAVPADAIEQCSARKPRQIDGCEPRLGSRREAHDATIC